MAREIALLTNPTAGKGAGRRARDVVVERLRDAGLSVRDLRGGTPTRRSTWPGPRWPTASSRSSCVGGDGMVHLGVQAVAETDTPLGIVPAGTGNDVARYFDLPAQGPGRGGRRG